MTQANKPSALQTLAARLIKVVQEELGLMARLDDDGDVVFRHPDLGTLYFSLSENDLAFMRLVYPGFAEAEDLGVTREQLMEVINDVNHRCKSVKIYAPREARVSAAIECFLAGGDEIPEEALLRAIAGRCLAAIRYAAGQVVAGAQALNQAH